MTSTLPGKRRECVDGPRPCPYLKCKYWLPEGACVLDEATGSNSTLQIGKRMHLSRQKIDQVLKKSLAKLPPEIQEYLTDGEDIH